MNLAQDELHSKGRTEIELCEIEAQFWSSLLGRAFEFERLQGMP
jgi:hypothetical protein